MYAMSTFPRGSTLLVVATLAACSSVKQDITDFAPEVGGLNAQLRSPTSAATGAVHVYDFRDGIQVQLSINNLFPGQYVIAFHEGNCRSPNLFSAGPPWAPPGWTKPAGELMPTFLANNDGNQTGYVAYVPGVHTDRPPSVLGKSVVIHAGKSVDQAFPGQPNNRMACGVLEPNQPFSF